MTSKERMAAAMRLERPDRTPVMCQMSIGHMLLQTGIPPVELWLCRERFEEALLALRRKYSFDGILVSLHGHSPEWESSIAGRVADGGGETVTWKDGRRTHFPPDDLPMPLLSDAPQFPSISGFDPDSIPDKLDFIPVSQGLHFAIDPGHPYDILESVLARAGGEFSIHGEVTSPFDYFLDLFGFAGAFLALAEEPDRSEDVLRRFAAGVARIAREQASLGVDAVKISSPFAGAGFISPSFYRRFVLPFEREIAESVRSLRRPGLHSHVRGDRGQAGNDGRIPDRRPGMPRSSPARKRRARGRRLAHRRPAFHQGQYRSREHVALRDDPADRRRSPAASGSRAQSAGLHPEHGLLDRAPDSRGPYRDARPARGTRKAGCKSFNINRMFYKYLLTLSIW